MTGGTLRSGFHARVFDSWGRASGVSFRSMGKD